MFHCLSNPAPTSVPALTVIGYEPCALKASNTLWDRLLTSISLSVTSSNLWTRHSSFSCPTKQPSDRFWYKNCFWPISNDIAYFPTVLSPSCSHFSTLSDKLKILKFRPVVAEIFAFFCFGEFWLISWSPRKPSRRSYSRLEALFPLSISTLGSFNLVQRLPSYSHFREKSTFGRSCSIFHQTLSFERRPEAVLFALSDGIHISSTRLAVIEIFAFFSCIHRFFPRFRTFTTLRLLLRFEEHF